MLKLTINNTTTLTAGDKLPLNVVFDTNDSLAYNKLTNEITFLKPGYYEINASVSFTNVTADGVEIQLYAGDEAIPEARAYAPVTSSTNELTVNISDLFKILPTAMPSYAKISVRTAGDGDVITAVVTVKKVR